MKVTEQNIVKALQQQYRQQPEGNELTMDLIYARMEQVKEILEFAQKYDGYQGSEVLFVAYLATQLQINEDSN